MAKDGAVAAAGERARRGRGRDVRKESPRPQIALNKAEVVCVTLEDYIVISTPTERTAAASANKAEVGSSRRPTLAMEPLCLDRVERCRPQNGDREKEKNAVFPALAAEPFSWVTVA